MGVGGGKMLFTRQSSGLVREVSVVNALFFNTAAFMTMASASATLMKELLHRPSSEFGFYFLLFPVGFFFGTFVSSRIGSPGVE